MRVFKSTDVYSPANVVELSRIPTGDFVGDLPVGYYPLPAVNYKTAFEEGQSYAHLLMLEAGMNLLKDDGLGVFIVPSNMLKKIMKRLKIYF